jgi:hypothetical protein
MTNRMSRWFTALVLLLATGRPRSGWAPIPPAGAAPLWPP